MSDIGDLYNFKIFLYLFPFLFSIIGFLLNLNNGDIINSIFFFFGLLLTILLGYIFKVLKIGTNHKKEINNICGVLLPNSLFEISTISISQLFYGYIISYIFLPKLLKMEEFKPNMILAFVFLLSCWFSDGITFYINKCSDINEILFGSFLGIFLSIFMLMVKKRYYGNEKPYKKPICSLMGNKYKCKKTEEDDEYENNYKDALSEQNKKNINNIDSQIVLIICLVTLAMLFLFVSDINHHHHEHRRRYYTIVIFFSPVIFSTIYLFLISHKK
tara:strand:+ start:4772 stop:5590 length:819 start_codon:yes stop_codon:yes gene_type:complete